MEFLSNEYFRPLGRSDSFWALSQENFVESELIKEATSIKDNSSYLQNTINWQHYALLICFYELFNDYSISLRSLAKQFTALHDAYCLSRRTKTVDFKFHSNKNTRHNAMYFYLTYMNTYAHISTSSVVGR